MKPIIIAAAEDLLAENEDLQRENERLRQENRGALQWLGAIITVAGGTVQVPDSALLHDYTVERIRDHMQAHTIWKATTRPTEGE